MRFLLRLSLWRPPLQLQAHHSTAVKTDRLFNLGTIPAMLFFKPANFDTTPFHVTRTTDVSGTARYRTALKNSPTWQQILQPLVAAGFPGTRTGGDVTIKKLRPRRTAVVHACKHIGHS